MIAGGILQAIHAFRRNHWSGLFLDLFTGIIYLAAGFMLALQPVAGAEILTLLIAAFLLVDGIVHIGVSLGGQLHNWGWLLLNGVVDVLLAALIWRQWPVSGLWVIGLFVGINMLFNGWSLVMLGLGVKSLPSRAY